jgi:hypothetical protein
MLVIYQGLMIEGCSVMQGDKIFLGVIIKFLRAMSILKNKHKYVIPYNFLFSE